MNNESNGVPGIDNLTPFEYALAGVTPSGDQDSPSLVVIEGMRLLAAEVEDAPVTDPRLQEFIRDGGANRRQNDRRSLKRRRRITDDSAEGGFVDITPIELAADNGMEPVMFQDAEPTSEQPAISLTDHDLAARGLADSDLSDPGLSDPDLSDPVLSDPELSSPESVDKDPAADGDPVIDLTKNPTGEAAVQAVAPADPSQVIEPGVETEELTPDLTALDATAEADAVLSGDGDGNDHAENGTGPTDGEHNDTEVGVGTAAAAGLGLSHLDEVDFAREFDAIKRAMFDRAASEDVETEPGAETVGSAGGDFELTTDFEGPLGSEMPVETGLDLGVGFDASMDDGANDGADHPSADDLDHYGRDQSGRFAGAALADSEAAFGGQPDHQDDGLWEQNEAAESFLLADDDRDRSPVPVAALTDAPPLLERRVGGAFWALAGTATAALLLGLGGFLWLNTLRGDAGQDTAASTVDASGSTENEPVAPASETSSDDDEADDASATGALGEDEGDREPLAVDGVDSPGSEDIITPTREADQDDQAVTGNGEDGNAETDQTTTTVEEDEPPVTETTAATTIPKTTIAPTTETPTTEPATTKAPATDPPTTPPVLKPTFIGDRITLGSFEGPGLAGVRVRLYEDRDRNGDPDELVSQTRSDSRGFYGFDEYPAGCYVIQFDQVPFEVDVNQDQARQPFCLAEGDQNGTIDAIAVVSPPDGCLVEADNGGSRQGVEVYDSDGYQGQSYVFYDRAGNVVVRTRNLGPPDDYDGFDDFEWFGPGNGFAHRQVFTVAAEYGDAASQPVTCGRGGDD